MEIRSWLDLRERLGAKIAHRIELHIVLVIEALANASWTDRQIREYLRSERWRDPNDESVLDVAKVLRSLAGEVGDDTATTAINCAVSDRGWPRTLDFCEVRPRTVRVHRPPTNDLIDYR